MTIGINGMAHVILTVSRFEVAREFYRKLLPEFGMKPVFDGDGFFYCVGARTAIGIEPCDPGSGRRALRATAGRPASPLPACAFARGRGPVRRFAKRNERDHRAWPDGRTVGSRILLCPI